MIQLYLELLEDLKKIEKIIHRPSVVKINQFKMKVSTLNKSSG